MPTLLIYMTVEQCVWSGGKGEVLWEVGWGNNIALCDTSIIYFTDCENNSVQAEMFSSSFHMERSFVIFDRVTYPVKNTVPNP